MCCAPAPRATPAVAVPAQDRDHVGGRLRGHYRHWRQLGNKTVRRWVRQGVTFDFSDGPPAPRPAFDSAERISDPVRFTATKETVLKYYKIGALETVPQGEEGQGTYMTFFPVEKKTPGEWRGCLEARAPSTKRSSTSTSRWRV